MNFDDLKSTWDQQDEPELLNQNRQQLMDNLIAEQSRFNRILFWRDFREVAAGMAAGIFFLVTGIRDGIIWPTLLAVFLIFCVCAYLLWNTHQWKKKEIAFDNTLRGDLEKRSAQLAHQIQLLSRNIIWSYFLPLFVAIGLIYWQSILNSGNEIEGFFMNLMFPAFFFVFLYGINWMAAQSLKKNKHAVDSELEVLLSGEVPALQNLPSTGRTRRGWLAFGICLAIAAAIGAMCIKQDHKSYPKLSPYAAIRWVDRKPEVRFQDQWYELLAIDELQTDEMITSAKWKYWGRWKKRFEEDLVELMTRMGHEPGELVKLKLRDLVDREIREFDEVPMTRENRNAIYEINSQPKKNGKP